jgi:hypothetical protein
MMSCAEYNVVLDKKAALFLLRALLSPLPLNDEEKACAVREGSAKSRRKLDVNAMVFARQRTLY